MSDFSSALRMELDSQCERIERVERVADVAREGVQKIDVWREGHEAVDVAMHEKFDRSTADLRERTDNLQRSIDATYAKIDAKLDVLHQSQGEMNATQQNWKGRLVVIAALVAVAMSVLGALVVKHL